MPVFQGDQPPSFVEFVERNLAGLDTLSFDVVVQNDGYRASGSDVHFERKIFEKWVLALGRVCRQEPLRRAFPHPLRPDLPHTPRL